MINGGWWAGSLSSKLKSLIIGDGVEKPDKICSRSSGSSSGNSSTSDSATCESAGTSDSDGAEVLGDVAGNK